MTAEDLLEKHLIANNAYEYDLLYRVVLQMIHDEGEIFSSVKSKIKSQTPTTSAARKKASCCVQEYVSLCDETNAGNILLFLTKLPVLAREIVDYYSGDCVKDAFYVQFDGAVMAYLKDLFMAGYNELFKNGENEVLFWLYYECERFVDALVLEMKSDISPMIDFKKPVKDDMVYLRRLLLNMVYDKQQSSRKECVDCNKDDCQYCRVLPIKSSRDRNIRGDLRLVNILTQRLKGKEIDDDAFAGTADADYIKEVKKLVKTELLDKQKKIVFCGNHKIFSTISAQRFDKIIKKRYNDSSYSQDRDIYYMLGCGIQPDRVFFGDDLIKNIHLLYEAYNVEDEKTGE